MIYLISGGGSSIVEAPLDDEISLDHLVATYRVLVGSGAPIAEINTIRKHLSAVKGGRIDLHRFVDTASTQAAKLFGLFPRKGAIQIGSEVDAIVQPLAEPRFFDLQIIGDNLQLAG